MSPASSRPTSFEGASRPVARVLVATTAMLAFISYWRAAAVVLNDLGSSAYYAGGEAEGAAFEGREGAGQEGVQVEPRTRLKRIGGDQ